MNTKKFFLSFISALLIITTVLTPVAYASNPFNNVWKSSAESIQKFNEYIASLSDEEAALILADEELVFNMKLDSYWNTPEISTNSVRSVSLPLSGSPAGSYYSYNGSACDCHSHCTYSVPSSAYSAYRCYYSYSGVTKSGNCVRYKPTGSIQCKGFADYVYHEYTGHDVGDSYTVSTSGYSSISNDTTGANLMKSFFTSLTVGSNVRLSVRGASYNHSVIVCSTSSTGVYIYDANRTGNCKIGYTFKTWSQLASSYSGIVKAWAA